MTCNIQFTKFLAAASSTVQDFENNAALCIETGDSTEYVRIMREKATFRLYTKDGGKPVFKAFSDTFTIQFFCLNNTVL